MKRKGTFIAVTPWQGGKGCNNENEVQDAIDCFKSILTKFIKERSKLIRKLIQEMANDPVDKAKYYCEGYLKALEDIALHFNLREGN